MIGELDVMHIQPITPLLFHVPKQSAILVTISASLFSDYSYIQAKLVYVQLSGMDTILICLESDYRYVQAPLAYPRERKRRMNGGQDWLPFCVYSDGQLADALSPCYWSDYYSTNPRAPHITQLAPWVAKYYLHRKIP